MNRITATLVIIICYCTLSSAQPKSIGIRTGAYGTGISYQHHISSEKFLSIDAGVDFGYNASGNPGTYINGTYNFIWASPQWTKNGSWKIYAGPGVSAGWVEDRCVIKNGEERMNHFVKGLMLAISGQVGLEYNFEFPLQLALEVRPCVGAHLADKTLSFYDNGFLGIIPSLGLRYYF